MSRRKIDPEFVRRLWRSGIDTVSIAEAFGGPNREAEVYNILFVMRERKRQASERLEKIVAQRDQARERMGIASVLHGRITMPRVSIQGAA